MSLVAFGFIVLSGVLTFAGLLERNLQPKIFIAGGVFAALAIAAAILATVARPLF
jgi:hypothetical protein